MVGTATRRHNPIVPTAETLEPRLTSLTRFAFAAGKWAGHRAVVVNAGSGEVSGGTVTCLWAAADSGGRRYDEDVGRFGDG